MNINPELTRIHVKNRSFFFKKNSKQTLEILNFRTCVKDQWKDCRFTDTKTSARTMTYFHCFFFCLFFFCFSNITQVLEQAIQLSFVLFY